MISRICRILQKALSQKKQLKCNKNWSSWRQSKSENGRLRRWQWTWWTCQQRFFCRSWSTWATETWTGWRGCAEHFILMAELYFFQAINDSFYLQVCRRLYALGTLPSLWRHFNLKVKFKKKESHRVLFIAQTLKRVTGIYRWINLLSSMSFVRLRLSYLAHLDLCDNDLSSLDPKLLARTVNTVQDCDIGYTDLTSEQVDVAWGIFWDFHKCCPGFRFVFLDGYWDPVEKAKHPRQ